MNPSIFPAIPLETARAARAVFGQSNFYLAVGDKANDLFDQVMLEDLSRRVQKPARTLAMLYLITIFQFIETLPDHLAVDALWERVDWKYAVRLPMGYPGLQAAELCDFRSWLVIERSGLKTLQLLLARLSDVTDFTSQQLSDLRPVQIISAVCQFSRLAKIWKTINQAMEALALRHPGWLLAASLPHWYERYSTQRKTLNLRGDKLEMYVLALAIGADGFYLLQAVDKANNPELANLEEIQNLRSVWHDQFTLSAEGSAHLLPQCAACPSIQITKTISIGRLA